METLGLPSRKPWKNTSRHIYPNKPLTKYSRAPPINQGLPPNHIPTPQTPSPAPGLSIPLEVQLGKGSLYKWSLYLHHRRGLITQTISQTTAWNLGGNAGAPCYPGKTTLWALGRGSAPTAPPRTLPGAPATITPLPSRSGGAQRSIPGASPDNKAGAGGAGKGPGVTGGAPPG